MLTIDLLTISLLFLYACSMFLCIFFRSIFSNVFKTNVSLFYLSKYANFATFLHFLLQAIIWFPLILNLIIWLSTIYPGILLLMLLPSSAPHNSLLHFFLEQLISWASNSRIEIELQQILHVIWYLEYIFKITFEGCFISPFVHAGHWLSSLLQQL